MSKIRNSARGQECQVRIIGVCNHNSETVIWAHPNNGAAGKGMGMKALDPLGAYCCSACHDVYDKRMPRPVGMRADDVDISFHEGHQRSFVMLAEKGLVKF
jgi:hypothetical protein